MTERKPFRDTLNKLHQFRIATALEPQQKTTARATSLRTKPYKSSSVQEKPGQTATDRSNRQSKQSQKRTKAAQKDIIIDRQDLQNRYGRLTLKPVQRKGLSDPDEEADHDGVANSDMPGIKRAAELDVLAVRQGPKLQTAGTQKQAAKDSQIEGEEVQSKEAVPWQWSINLVTPTSTQRDEEACQASALAQGSPMSVSCSPLQELCTKVLHLVPHLSSWLRFLVSTQEQTEKCCAQQATRHLL